MIIRRLRYWLDRSRREAALRTEIEQHIEEAARELHAGGRSPTDARAEAMRRFGRTATAQESSREVWIWRLASDLYRDARYALRNIARNPGFAAVTMLSAALGIAACTTVFGIVNFALLRPLPVADPERLMTITGMHLEDGLAGDAISYGEVLDIRRQSRSLEGVAAFAPLLAAGIAAGGEGRRHWGQLVSGNYFDTVKPAFALGGGFIDGADDVPGAAAKIVLGHALWQSRFGGDPAIAGRTIHVNQQPMTVTGVTAPGFRGTEVALAPDFFIPLSQVSLMNSIKSGDRDRLRGYGHQWLMAAARLRPEYNETQARTELALLARDIATRAGAMHAKDRSLYAERAGQLIPAIRKVALPAFLLLLAVTFLVLLTACANVANLMLARASARSREISTRLALGAGRTRLIRQLMTESVLLALGGGIVGLALGEWAGRHIGSFRLPVPLPIDLTMHTDSRVTLFAAALAAITGIAFGLVPAFRATRQDLMSAMKLDRRFGLRNALVVSQVAFSAMLVICSGLFLRSLGAAQSLDSGMDPRNVLLVRFDPALGQYDNQSASRLIEGVVRDAEAVPGVRSASVVNVLPLGLGGNNTEVSAEGSDPERGRIRTAILAVGPRYFETLGIRMVNGADFRVDSRGAVAIVNQALAAKLYPGQEAVGRHLIRGGEKLRILAVVANSKSRMIQDSGVNAILYKPILGAVLSEGSFGGITLLVKTSDNAAALASRMRQAVLARDPQMVVNDAGTMESQVIESLFIPRLAASLFGLCGGMGLLIASIGVYGVISFGVARRSREIGIRMALGALPSQVIRSVIGHGLALSAVGILIGLGGGFALARAARALLVGVSSSDPLTFLAVPVILLFVALVASAIPARRAAAIDPNLILRSD